MPITHRLLATLKISFGIVMASAFAVAVSPMAVSVPVDNGDKILHAIAFYGLTLLAALSFPRANLITIALGMSAFGALIELVQGLPFVGRDREFADWAADTAAVVAALAPFALASFRQRLVIDAT